MRTNFLKGFAPVVLIALFFVFNPYFGYAQEDCTCTEYIYLNETTNGGSVHKYAVAADGTLTEILNAGNAWYPGATTSELPSPHGVGTDFNGFVYIGEGAGGNMRKLTCDGTIIPASEFEIFTGAYQYGTIGNQIFVNPPNSDFGDNVIEQYDLCTGDLVGVVCFGELADGPDDWGFYIDPNTGDFYTTQFVTIGSAGLHSVSRFTINDFEDPAAFDGSNCVVPLIKGNNWDSRFIDGTPDSPPLVDVNVGDNLLPEGDMRGITTDEFGNIYIVQQDNPSATGNPRRSGRLLKYDANGNFIAATAWDITDSTTDLDGLWFPLGIVYSVTSGTLFISRGDPLSNCVQEFDTNLNDLGAAVPPGPAEDIAKGIFTTTECCPTNAITTIDEVICDPTVGDQLFIQDYINCSSPICEGGLYMADPANEGATLNTCDNSIEITGSGCSTFTKGSDGMSDTSQCAAFSITLNICFEFTPAAPVISVTDNTCNPDVAGIISVDTPCSVDSTIEWSTDGGANWSATQPTYSDTPVTVRARCINGCGDAETEDVTTAPQECCPPVNCIDDLGSFTIIKNTP